MNVLIVEDDSFKMDAIAAVVREASPEANLSTASSLRGAMTSLESGSFDYVILDMAIPSHTSDVGAIDTYSQPVGGLDALLYLASSERRERVVVLTQYPTVEYDRSHVALKDLQRVLEGDGIENVAAVILFADDGEWKARLLFALGVLK